MNLNGLFNIAAAIVTVALVTTVVANPYSAAVIGSVGQAFGGSIRAAMGH